MSISVKWYGLGLQDLVDTPRDLEGVTLKLALATSSYTPNLDTHDFFDDVTNELGSGNGYTSGGATLSNVLWSYDSSSDQVRLDFDDVSWTFTTGKTWLYGIVYVDTAGASSTDPVIALLTWDTSQTVSTAYTLVIDSAGLLYLDVT